jgi:hypothetical protein
VRTDKISMTGTSVSCLNPSLHACDQSSFLCISARMPGILPVCILEYSAPTS